jgi:Rrf2 family protein
MIRVSTKGRYALRAMVDLARRFGNGPIARHDIAARQDISADYVAQLFRPLQNAGLVEGVKGPGGGYRLTRAPSEIRVRDVVEALEGPIALAPCVEDQPQERDCSRADCCATRDLWERLSTAIRELLDAYTLHDLSSEAGRLAGVPGEMS